MGAGSRVDRDGGVPPLVRADLGFLGLGRVLSEQCLGTAGPQDEVLDPGDAGEGS